MGIQLTTHNFIDQIAQRVRILAAVELFGGDLSKTSNKMALDYIVPALNESQELGLALVVKVSCLNVATDHIVERPVFVHSKFTTEQVMSGSVNWPTQVEAIAYGLVKSMSVTLREIKQAKIKLLVKGDYYKAQSNVKRVWV